MPGPVTVVEKTGQFWVVNTSPPGPGPGGALRTQYTIVEGTQADAANIPNGGGISGPYASLHAAYLVWRGEPGNQDVSPLTKILQDLSLAEQDLTKTGSGTGGFASNPQAIQNPLTGLAAIGDFFQRLTQPATWVRVGEVALGGILIYAGVRALAHGSAVAGSGARASATRPVKKVAKKTAKIVVPEARLAGRTVAKKAAPKTTARITAHRERVAKYGAKKPFTPPSPPKPRPPTVRESHIYYHRSPKPRAKPVKK